MLERLARQVREVSAGLAWTGVTSADVLRDRFADLYTEIFETRAANRGVAGLLLGGSPVGRSAEVRSELLRDAEVVAVAYLEAGASTGLLRPLATTTVARAIVGLLLHTRRRPARPRRRAPRLRARRSAHTRRPGPDRPHRGPGRPDGHGLNTTLEVSDGSLLHRSRAAGGAPPPDRPRRLARRPRLRAGFRATARRGLRARVRDRQHRRLTGGGGPRGGRVQPAEPVRAAARHHGHQPDRRRPRLPRGRPVSHARPRRRA